MDSDVSIDGKTPKNVFFELAHISAPALQQLFSSVTNDQFMVMNFKEPPQPCCLVSWCFRVEYASFTPGCLLVYDSDTMQPPVFHPCMYARYCHHHTHLSTLVAVVGALTYRIIDVSLRKNKRILSHCSTHTKYPTGRPVVGWLPGR